MEKSKIIPTNNHRFEIINNKNEVVDNANGYGYKTKKSASKALWYKFKGGKEKKKKDKATLKELLTNKLYKDMNDRIEDILICSFKEISYGETTIEKFFDIVESEFNEKIPNLIKKEYK